MGGEGFHDAEGDVGGGADVEDDAFRGEPGDEGRVLNCPYAVGDPLRAEHVECGAHAGRAGKFSRVRGGDQPGGTGDGEGFGERLGGTFGLVSGQAEGDHTVARPPGRETGGLDGRRRIRVTAGEHHDPEADAQPGGGTAALLDHDVQHVERGVRIGLVGQGVHMRLDPHRAVRGGVLDHFAHQPQQLLPRTLAHQPRGDAVRGPEVREGHQAAHVRRVFTSLAHQLRERVGPHRAFEMDMEMGLRQTNQAAHAASLHDHPRDGQASVVGRPVGQETPVPPRPQ